MTPKIEFRYSWVYDQKWKGSASDENYPSEENILRYIEEVKMRWQAIEENIFKEISFATGFDWYESPIKVYAVGKCVPFSDPLTIGIFNKSANEFLGVLMHELIHQLLIQNGNRTDKFFESIFKKYPQVSMGVKVHVLVHAMWTRLVEKFFNAEMIEKEIDWAKDYPDYKAAWDIVLKDGYEEVLNDLRALVVSA